MKFNSPIYILISNFTFTNINWCKWIRKLQIYENTKLAIIPTLPTMCYCEKLEFLSVIGYLVLFVIQMTDFVIYHINAFRTIHHWILEMVNSGILLNLANFVLTPNVSSSGLSRCGRSHSLVR